MTKNSVCSWGTLLLPAVACFLVGVPVRGQGTGTATASTDVVKMFHPTGPLPSYEVATIKRAPEGGFAETIKDYILNAYGVSSLSQGQVVGGPAWIGTDAYVIQGKVPDALREAMQKMTPEEQGAQNCMLRESLLAERFKLKMHFETREMPIYELTAAKGGLKVKEVPPPPPIVPGTPPPPLPPGVSQRPGSVMMQAKGGITTLNARAATMRLLINLLRGSVDVSGEPIVDKTGFSGNFDVVDLRWASGLAAAQAPGGANAAGGDVDAPALATALDEQLGLKLTATKGPVEVVVIDSIERPTEN